MSLLLDAPCAALALLGNRRLGAPDFPELAFTSAHARDAGALPRHYGDPFDRALVAQARTEGLVLVTADPAMQAYDVALLDATR